MQEHKVMILTHRLAITLPHGPGEAPTAYVSRLAMINGQSAKVFSEHQGFDLQDIVQGDRKVLCALAVRTGADMDGLVEASYRLTDVRHYERKGLVLPRHIVISPEIRGCPACLREDARRSDLPHQLGMIYRADWRLSHVQVCIRHSLPLAVLWTDRDRLWRHDFATKVGLIFDAIMAGEMDGQAVDVSEFDRWVHGRLRNLAPAIWLDQFDFHAAATFCELLGRSAILAHTGRRDAKWKRDTRRPSSIGFECAKRGEAGVRDWLTQIQQRSGSPNDGANARFGALHDRLSRDLSAPEFEPFRSILRTHMMQTWPLGPGDQVLGVPVKERVLHSVRSASNETGLGTVRLRKAFAKAGLVAKDATEISDAWDVFDATAAAPILSALTTGIGAAAAQKDFNFPRDQFDLAVEAGFLRPIATGDGTHPIFARQDIQAFLNRLMTGAMPRLHVHGTSTTIPKAARQLLCSSKEIMQLLMEQKLQKVGRLTDQTGFLSILVDQREVRPFLMRAEAIGLNQAEVSNALRLAAIHVRALIKDGIMPATLAPNPATKKQQHYITNADFSEFNRVYVTLAHIAEDLGLDNVRARRDLLAAKVYPFGGLKRPYGAIYKRQKIAALFLRDWPRATAPVCIPGFLAVSATV